MESLSGGFTASPAFKTSHSLFQEKTTSEFFQPSARARVLCCKNEVMLHKTYLAICSGANKSVREGWKSSLSGKDASCLENFGLPLGAKLLRLAPKSLTSHDATNTQIGATSTQLAKRVEKELRRYLYLPVEGQIEDVLHRKSP